MGRPIQDAIAQMLELQASLKAALEACRARHEEEEKREKRRKKLHKRLPDYVDLVGLFTGRVAISVTGADVGPVLTDEQRKRLENAARGGGGGGI